jgi:hypothetical protein
MGHYGDARQGGLLERMHQIDIIGSARWEESPKTEAQRKRANLFA